MRGSFEALNLFVEIPDLAERLGPRFPFDERARFLEDPDRLREVVPLQLQIEQLAPGFAHLLLYEIGDVSLEAFGRLLPDAGRGFDVPPFQRLARLAQEALRGRDIHPHCAYFMCEAVPLLDRLPRIVEILRLGLKSVEDDLVGVPGAVVVAGFHPADGLQESRSDEADAGLSLRRSNLLDETLDSFADEVHEGDIEGTPGVRDQCDRALDVAPLPRLDGVVDDPLPFVDFESDPFRGDQEGFHLVHELRAYSVAAPSENSAPHPGQTVASAATRVSHTGQRNFSPSSRAVDTIEAESEAAAVSPASGELRATLFNDSMISRWSSLPSMIEARISSMLRPSRTGTSTGSCGPPARSNRVRAVWHEGHTRASASMEESQT